MKKRSLKNLVKDNLVPKRSQIGQSKFAPKNNAEWIKSLGQRGVISEDKADDLTRHKPTPGPQGLGKGTAPLAEIVRPGHFDHTAPALRPNYRADPLSRDPDELREQASPVDNNSLERSSSSLLVEEQRLLREDHDEEIGKLGFQFYCIQQHKYRTSKVLRTKEEANLFATVLVLLIIVWYLPTLVLQATYVFSTRLRSVLVGPIKYEAESSAKNMTINYILMIALGALLVVYAMLIYISGVARRHPYHMIMIIAKSTLWAFICLMVTAITDYYFILVTCVQKDDRFINSDEDLHDHWEATIFPECLDLHSHHKNIPLFVYFCGVALGEIFFLLYFFLAWCTKFNFFGPYYPFISYTVSWVLSTVITTFMLKNIFNLNHNQIPWNMVQCVAAPVIATCMTQMYVSYITRLIQGNVCPLQPKEFLYATANY